MDRAASRMLRRYYSQGIGHLLTSSYGNVNLTGRKAEQITIDGKAMIADGFSLEMSDGSCNLKQADLKQTDFEQEEDYEKDHGSKRNINASASDGDIVLSFTVGK